MINLLCVDYRPDVSQNLTGYSDCFSSHYPSRVSVDMTFKSPFSKLEFTKISQIPKNHLTGDMYVTLHPFLTPFPLSFRLYLFRKRVAFAFSTPTSGNTNFGGFP